MGVFTAFNRRSEMAETIAVQQLTDAEFESTVQGGKPVFVDFWAPWSRRSCRASSTATCKTGLSFSVKAGSDARLFLHHPVRHALRQPVVAVPLLVKLQQGVAVIAAARRGRQLAGELVEHVVEVALRVLLAELAERRAVDR